MGGVSLIDSFGPILWSRFRSHRSAIADGWNEQLSIVQAFSEVGLSKYRQLVSKGRKLLEGIP